MYLRILLEFWSKDKITLAIPCTLYKSLHRASYGQPPIHKTGLIKMYFYRGTSTLDGHLLLRPDYCLGRYNISLRLVSCNRAEGSRDLGKSPASTRGLGLYAIVSAAAVIWVHDEPPSIWGGFCMTEDKDVVAQCPGFSMSGPQQCPHRAGDRSLPGRFHSHAPLSSLSPAC